MAANIPLFSLQRTTWVEPLAADRLLSVCRLRDEQTVAEVRLTAALPGLEILELGAEFEFARLRPPADLKERLARLVGVRVGSGMLKIIPGLIGPEEGCRQPIYMVEECCHGIILSLTRKVLLAAPDDPEGRFTFYSGLVEKSIRLYDRCAAYAAGTPLVAAYEAGLRRSQGESE